MLAYFLDMPSLFKPPVEVGSVSLVSLNILDNSVKQAIRLKYKDVKTVSLATSVVLHCTKYSEGIFVSFGSTSGLPDFAKILKVLIVGNKASFIIECFSAWYLEHFRCYELSRKLSTDLEVADPEELNSFYPLAPYMVQGRLMLSPKVFLLHEAMLLHVILADDDIRRVQIETLPETVDELKTTLKSKLNLEGDVVIQFQDPEFNSELYNLTDMSELPTERPRLKVILKTPPSVASLDSGGSDTASMSSASSVCVTPRSRHWPDHFTIPTFTYDVELKLRKGNEAYERDGSLLTVTAAMKRDILDRVASAMYEYSAYPTSKQIEDVANALIEKHPCLREPGSSHGWYCWKFSLSFKMGNLRQKYRIAGCPDLTVNQNRSMSTSSGNQKLKKAKRSEINFLPDIPEGRSPDSLESERVALMDEMKKKKKDGKMIDCLMESTFALRRKEIVDGEPPVSEIEDRWPALFSERQISAEFMRLVSTDLYRSFFDGLEKYAPRLLEMYRVRSSSNSDLRCLLQLLDVQGSNQKRRAAALLGLPYYLKEDPNSFICVCEASSSEEDATKGVDIGLLIVTEDGGNKEELQEKELIDVAVVLEEHMILHDLRDVPNAFATLMGLLYCLNIDYPKGLKYTFELVQKVLMGIGSDNCSAKVHGLRNKMLQGKV